MKDLIFAKLKEGSTWAGLAAVVAGLSIPHAAEFGAIVPHAGMVVAGLLSIYFK